MRGKTFIGLVLSKAQAKALHKFLSGSSWPGVGPNDARRLHEVRTKLGKQLDSATSTDTRR